jgi:hypothetical protein
MFKCTNGALRYKRDYRKRQKKVKNILLDLFDDLRFLKVALNRLIIIYGRLHRCGVKQGSYVSKLFRHHHLAEDTRKVFWRRRPPWEKYDKEKGQW